MNDQTKKILIIGAMTVALLLTNPGSSSAAESLIIDFEVGPTGNPYLKAIPDTNGRWQIGYGSTWNYDKNRWVVSGDTITADQAIRWMRNEIAEKGSLINRVVKVPINANQRNALISLSYNIGSTAFEGSTLLRLLNQGIDKYEVADQFDRWIYADGQILPGLVNRRASEKRLFLS